MTEEERDSFKNIKDFIARYAALRIQEDLVVLERMILRLEQFENGLIKIVCDKLGE